MTYCDRCLRKSPPEQNQAKATELILTAPLERNSSGFLIGDICFICRNELRQILSQTLGANNFLPSKKS